MKKIVAVIMITAFAACKKEQSPNEISSTPVIEREITMEQLYTPGGSLTNNTSCFVNLYNGTTYNYSVAAENAINVDFCYTYKDGIRLLDGRKQLFFNTSIGSNGFIVNAEKGFGVTQTDFENVKNTHDMDRLFSEKKITIKEHFVRITNPSTDLLEGSIFAFLDKNNKPGLLLITTNFPKHSPGNPVPDPLDLNFKIKIEK